MYEGFLEQPDTVVVMARFELAPDWICEVLSPSTQAIDRADKLPIYASHGVRHAWVIEPMGQTLAVYRWESNGGCCSARIAAQSPFARSPSTWLSRLSEPMS